MPKSGRERPQIIVVHHESDHGCLITLILLIVAWPLAILYWMVRVIAWLIGAVVDLITFGPLRRRGRYR